MPALGGEVSMIDELMLLSGAAKAGGKQMATMYWDSRSRSYKTRRRRRRRSSSFSGLGTLGGATSLKATLGDVKGVLITGAIAAGGAITTEALFDKVAGSLALEGYTKELAKAATGIALGIMISKITKKPRLGAAFAIGPVVAAGMRIFAELLGTSSTAGLGLVTLRPLHPTAPPTAGLGQLTQIATAPGMTPAWMQNPTGRMGQYTLAS